MTSIESTLGKYNPALVSQIPSDELELDSPVPSPEDYDSGTDPATALAPDELYGATVSLPRGDSHSLGQVMGRKRDPSGSLIGTRHDNPILDSRVYLVGFPDGATADVSYNTIASHLHSLVGDDGVSTPRFHEIINHRRTSQVTPHGKPSPTDGIKPQRSI
jgi:hypothetical protein